MNKKVPYTPLSTHLSGSARETELRLRNIFSGPKKRPPVLFLALVFAVCVFCGNLVSCQNAEVENPDTPDFTADLTFSITETEPDGATVNIQGTVGNFAVPSGTSWHSAPIFDIDLLGQILIPYPPFGGENGMIFAWWADESRTTVTVTGQPLAMTTSGGDYTGWRTFTVTFDGNSGDVTESHIHGSEENIYLASLSDGEAVTLARFAAELLAGAEAYYQSYTEDHVLLSLKAPLADGRTLTLDAVGKKLDEYHYGVREVLVYDGDALLQTVSAREATEEVWGWDNYTECWSPEAVMETLDLNFDGNTDFGLFGWVANNTIPYYYWQWDGEQYQYACTLQGAEVHPGAGEVSSEYKSGWGGAIYQRDYYRPDGDGYLYLVRQERERIDFPNLDADRGNAIETWVPREGAVIRPGGAEQNEEDFVLIRRKIPVYEINSDNTVSHFTEIWEQKDGQLRMTSRDQHIER